MGYVRIKQKLNDGHIHFNLKALNPVEDLNNYIISNAIGECVLIINSKCEFDLLKEAVSKNEDFLENKFIVFALSRNDFFIQEAIEFAENQKLQFGIKIHPRLTKMTTKDVFWYKSKLNIIDSNIIIVDDFFYGNIVSPSLAIELICMFAEIYPNKKIITVFGCPGGKAQLRRKDLGHLSGIHSAISYLTAEDPGPEETIDICKEIASYITKEHGKYKIIEDRGQAIKQAILENPNSVILITGKGNETRQKYGKQYLPCLTDTEYAKEALEEYDKKTT